MLQDLKTTTTIENDRLDPTRSSNLRRAGRGLVNGRVINLNRQLRQLLQEQDLPGLNQSVDLSKDFGSWIEPIGRRLERSETMLRQAVGGILTSPPNWLDLIIIKAIQQGTRQASKELKANIGDLDIEDVVAFQTSWASTEIQGISDETRRRILSSINNALQVKQRPVALMRDVRVTLEKITRLRLNMLVNTSVVKSVNAGKLLTYRANGITKIGVKAERLPKKPVVAPVMKDHRHRHYHHQRVGMFLDEELVNVLTAGDDDVCDDCEDIASDGPYDIDEANGLIPAHVNCRCAFVPWYDSRYLEQEYERERENDLEEKG